MTGGVPLAELIAAAAASLRAAGIGEPRREARTLAVHVLGLAREAMVSRPDQPVAGAARARFDAAVSRRAAREPFARIVGRREFWSLDFVLGPDTLVPRPETETLVAAVLDHVAGRDRALAILDLGTGSGCILLALLHELPRATGIGVDIAAGAVAVARANAARLGLAPRARFAVGDWAAAIGGTFDVVVCNPPYIGLEERGSLEPEVRDHDPARALFAGPDGLDGYRAIATDVDRLLAPGGIAAFECAATKGAEVAGILGAVGLPEAEVHCDLGGRSRVVLIRKPAVQGSLTGVKKTIGKGGIPV